jgi:hypothetical protein
MQSAAVFQTNADSKVEEMMAKEQRLKMRVSGLEDQVSRSSFLETSSPLSSSILSISRTGI